MIKNDLQQLVLEGKSKGLRNVIIKNILKEYIQYLVLSLIYNQKNMKNLIFKGGSCLRICYDIPRLSEDLDFDYNPATVGNNPLIELNRYLIKEIKEKYYPDLEIKIQGSTGLYLKFPFLKDLRLADGSESNKLYVKVETTNRLSSFANFEMTPVSKYGFNFIINHYDLPTLMSGKIEALLFRIWYKEGKTEKIDIKGRDFYDLFWFLQKGIEPNWRKLKKSAGIKNFADLKKLLLKRVAKVVTPQKLSYDLSNFINDEQFVNDFSKNYLSLIKKYL
ncbi:nucleotidyl transferase AbiEii/AbiGii toxin family protein [Patescibacteria group bacterium]|nr:nucleotidyl transferase AbiEii/AbiGii toxin family protein [Patescibacteria group bacterium]